ncbi:hypothetical protein ACJVC5_14280 [Peredibacter sp. HCB2-198]|uniref:hypothetical protein n=1 Tax=Peredibacter sp. HCB2-198 TaxID=3383025 RepID=UPI0038B4C11E
MNLIKWMLINLVLLMVTIAPVWALNGAVLLGQSSSGQTALFNLGIHDGVKEGDYAVIVKEIRDLETRDLRLVPVAKARNIKINTGNSVWILYKVYDAELMVKGQKYLILAESAMLSGRRDPRLGRISIVTNKDKRAFEVQKTLSDDKDRIAKLKNQYPEIADLHKREMRSDNDIDLVDVEGWKKFKDEKYRTALYKSPSQDDFRRELNLNTFEKLVTGYLKKVNDPKFSYDQFYDEQMKSDFSNEFRKRSNFSTEYESFLSNQSQRAAGDAKLYRAILEKGDSWSEDFSDEELGSKLKQVSVLQEKDRRDYVMSNPNRYTVYLEYGLGLNDPQTDKDTRYRRDTRYSVDLDFEAVPFLKHDILERFTLNATVRSNKTAFDASGNNANVDEYSFTGGANWYPLYAPYVIEAPVVFLGVYLRSGWASVEAPTVEEKANYTVLSLPGFRAGMKYNFKNNLALRVAASMERLELDRYEQSKLGSVLPDQTSVAEGKLNFALAYSF